MTEAILDQTLLDELKRYDTPTICNALEIVMPQRRNIGFTTEPLVCADPSLPSIVGYARTATIRAVGPAAATAEVSRSRRIAYYEYIAAAPTPTVTVIQDLDPNPGFGAFWGEVNTSIHKGLGCLGVITNGSIRDLDMVAPGFQLLAGKIGPSHAFVHVVDFKIEVNIYGMTVRHGDLVHADRHGAVVIPREAAAQLPAAIDLVARREKVILDACREPGFDIERLKKAIGDSAEIH